MFVSQVELTVFPMEEVAEGVNRRVHVNKGSSMDHDHCPQMDLENLVETRDPLVETSMAVETTLKMVLLARSKLGNHFPREDINPTIIGSEDEVLLQADVDAVVGEDGEWDFDLDPSSQTMNTTLDVPLR